MKITFRQVFQYISWISFSRKGSLLFELEEERKLRALAAARLKLLLWSQNFCNLASLQNCSASRGWMALNAAVMPRSKQRRFLHFVHIVHDYNSDYDINASENWSVKKLVFMNGFERCQNLNQFHFNKNKNIWDEMAPSWTFMSGE